MRNRILLCGALFLLVASVSAQELRVKSFEKLERDLIARTNPRLDRNDVPCAVLRVSVPDAKSCTFVCNTIGDPIYRPGEAIVYLTDRSRKIRINSEKYGTFDYEFPERLEKNVTYKLSLRVILSSSQKTRTLVMPLVGVGEEKVISYGVMLAIVKKWGGYAKVKMNFEGEDPYLSCKDDGSINISDSYAWFSRYGENSTTRRFAITGGAICRLTLPLYLYFGGGYGKKTLSWKLADGNWIRANEHSFKGVESEVGLIWRINNFALLAGVQNIEAKYWEASFGFGIMF